MWSIPSCKIFAGLATDKWYVSQKEGCRPVTFMEMQPTSLTMQQQVKSLLVRTAQRTGAQGCVTSSCLLYTLITTLVQTWALVMEKVSKITSTWNKVTFVFIAFFHLLCCPVVMDAVMVRRIDAAADGTMDKDRSPSDLLTKTNQVDCHTVELIFLPISTLKERCDQLWNWCLKISWSVGTFFLYFDFFTQYRAVMVMNPGFWKV